MIVVPRVLTELLREAEPDLQRRMALDFARSALERSRALVDEYDDYCAYLDVAGMYLQGEVSIDEVAIVASRFRENWIREAPSGDSWGPVPGLSGEVGDVVRQAVDVACQRDLEEAGHATYRKHQVRVGQVAKDAQFLVAELAAQSSDCVRWEEGRRQLLHLIEQTPNPHR